MEHEDALIGEAEALLRRAREGEDVRAELARLPAPLRTEAELVVEVERQVRAALAAPPPPSRPATGRHDPWLGQTLSGCVLERLLGRGGMGAAYLARRAGRPVVVKLMTPDGAASPELRARLRREAEALRRIRAHPSLVAVLAADVDGEGPPHLVLEYVEGTTLRAALREPLPWRTAVGVARDVARGLAVLHGHGLLHRDVKPENIIVQPDGRARLLDLGIAKDAFVSTALTQPGQLVGTAEFMAPEQWTGAAQDARTDVFSLGATLYDAVCGRPPFQGDGLDELMDAATSGDFPRPRALRPELPVDLERVLLCALDPSPRFRYPRMEPLAHDLERLLVGAPPEGLPALVEGATRHALLPGWCFTVGSAQDAAVRVAGAAARHAEVRREEAAFTIVDLGGGTFVGDERVAGSVTLSDGDVLRLGAATLVVSDPGGRRRPPPIEEDLERAERLEPVVVALARAGDPRATAELLERLTPDPLVERAARATLEALAGPGAARLLARRAQLVTQAAAEAVELLVAASGRRLGDDPVAWLGWWMQSRGGHLQQVVAARPERALELVPSTPGAAPTLLLAGPGEAGLLLVGRDVRCHLRLDDPGVSRLHLTVLRLGRRLLVRDEGAAGGTELDGRALHGVAFLDPGSTLRLGSLALRVEGAEVEGRGPSGQRIVDPCTFQALEEVGHPSVLTAQLDLMEAALEALRPAALEAEARALATRPERGGPLAEALREAWARRGHRARVVLAAALGGDAAGDPATVRAAVLARAGAAPQVAPAGLLRASQP